MDSSKDRGSTFRVLLPAAVRVEFAGNRFKVLFNGKHLFDAEDSTFKGAGKVGLWTKADSVMQFDDFRYGAK